MRADGACGLAESATITAYVFGRHISWPAMSMSKAIAAANAGLLVHRAEPLKPEPIWWTAKYVTAIKIASPIV